MGSETQELVIDSEFSGQLWPLSTIELAHLEASIMSVGCRESLKVWAGANILVDGHNRYAICQHNNVPFRVEYLEFSSRDEAADWIDKNQAARRNCTPDQYKIITGRIYNRRKKTKSEAGAKGGVSKDQIDPCFENTAKEVAAELGVSAPTIKRNGQRAEVHDKMVAIGDTEAAESAKTVPQSVIAEAKSQSVDGAAELLKKHHITKCTGENEWYTPSEFVEAARETMGSIDLDPASCKRAQATVRATKYYSLENDGLTQQWSGNVWMNPPYSKGMVSRFAEKFVDSMTEIKQAVVLVNNATETEWFQLFARHCRCICFPASRIRFIDKDGDQNNSPMQGQVFFYFGDRPHRFVDFFAKFGECFGRDHQ